MPGTFRERAAALSPKAVLETAAGSGVVTRALAPKLAPDARYVATDLNQPMLDYAAARQNTDSRISWRKADAQALPFEDATFDVVCCQFGAMFFPDRPSGYREARRVLKPGGCFLFNVWDRIEENVFADDVTNALAAFFPDDPPRFLARTPHGYHDTALIRRDLEKAGFSDVTIETRGGAEPRALAAPCRDSPIARERRYATRSRPEARTSSRPRPTTPRPRSRDGMATAKSPPRSRPTSSRPEPRICTTSPRFRRPLRGGRRRGELGLDHGAKLATSFPPAIRTVWGRGMTYCCGVLVRDGLVMIADTRTNAGLDNVSTFRKLQSSQSPASASWRSPAPAISRSASRCSRR